MSDPPSSSSLLRSFFKHADPDERCRCWESTSSGPTPGTILCLQSRPCDRSLSLQHGQVILAPGTHLGQFWTCETVNNDGWFGLRNWVSGSFLGYQWGRELICAATKIDDWEKIRLERSADGGWFLVMDWWWKRYRVGIKTENGVERPWLCADLNAREGKWDIIVLYCPMCSRQSGQARIS